MTDGSAPLKNNKENYGQNKKGHLAVQKMSKKQLLKTTSRSKLAKIHGKVAQENNIVIYNAQMQTEPDLHNYKSFRKGIIDKIFSHKGKQIITEKH